ncbi:MAG: GAF domain-containing protein [Epsilonproteobacteria bacterium]|nr:GAF domain-containing protein [Campylobacterota bacterium]
MLENDIRFLGTGGSKKECTGSSCVLVSENIVIDAGNILNGLGDGAKYIEHIFLTHSHLDHISDIAFLVDIYFQERHTPLKIYGLKETLEALNEHVFNWDIWPDFKEISLVKAEHKSIEFIELELNKEYVFNNVSLKPIALNHTVPTCGYVIKKRDFSAIYASDTYLCDSIWYEANENSHIDSIIIDVSFPSEMEELADHSKHLTPKLLKEEQQKLTRDDLNIYVTHVKPNYRDIIEKELEILNVLWGEGRVLSDGEYLKNNVYKKNRDRRAMEISTALSKEKDLSKILGMILEEAIEYTGAEGGTIYLKEADHLTFKAVKNDKLGIYEIDTELPKIHLHRNGKENQENVSAVCALSKQTINIPDIYLYHFDGFNFEGTKKFDKANNYRSKSMLVIPMMNQDDEVVGVMQLINKVSYEEVATFTHSDIEMTTTYANLAASAIAKNWLIEDLEKLVYSFLESISYALSVKSPYGYGHINRVKDLMVNVVKEIDSDTTTYKDIQYTKEQFEELELAAWMHDIGKIATPEHILDKATRLETLYDRINVIEMRFNFIKSSLECQMLDAKCKFLNGDYRIRMDDIEHRHKLKIAELAEDLEFLKRANKPFTVMGDEQVERLKEIAAKNFMIEGQYVHLLNYDEVQYLTIRNGTLSDKERNKINEHAKTTFDMLKMITFPKKYSKVPEIASGHHEKLNGTGYPLGLKAEEISFETRLLAIIDILEALTASDRPYKRAKTEQETFEILDLMVQKGELDGALVKFIKDAKIFDKYIQVEQKEEALV